MQTPETKFFELRNTYCWNRTHCKLESHWSPHKVHRSDWRISHSVPAEMVGNILRGVSTSIVRSTQAHWKHLQPLFLTSVSFYLATSLKPRRENEDLAWIWLTRQSPKVISADLSFHCHIYIALSCLLSVASIRKITESWKVWGWKGPPEIMEKDHLRQAMYKRSPEWSSAQKEYLKGQAGPITTPMC